MTKKNNRTTRDIYRSAVDGKFITKKKAERNPRESVKERMKK
jgi:hypothetical protein